jgi:PAS domain S-box-containing protein
MGKPRVEMNSGVEDSDELSVFTETFASFNSTIKSLNDSYASLQDRYQKLGDELSETNEKLRTALEDREQTRKFLENVLESLTSGVLTIDLNGYITGINRAGCQILKTEPDDILNCDYRALFHGSLMDRSALTDLLEGKEPYHNVEKNIRVGARAVPVSVSSALITDPDGGALGAVEAFVDLSELKRMEDEIARVKSLAALGEVAAVIAHEVRNPLSGISGFAMLLKRELGKDHPNMEYVDKIMAGVDKLDRCVSSLLDYARDLPLNTSRGDLREFLNEAVEFFKVDLSTRKSPSKVAFVVPESPVYCSYDSEQMSRALMNLFQNADQAMPNGGTVTVSLEETEIGPKIKVADEGESVPVEIREKIFTPFFTTREGGTGLGLSLVKKIVEAHHGRVDLFTNGDTGSVFTITLQP